MKHCHQTVVRSSACQYREARATVQKSAPCNTGCSCPVPRQSRCKLHSRPHTQCSSCHRHQAPPSHCHRRHSTRLARTGRRLDSTFAAHCPSCKGIVDRMRSSHSHSSRDRSSCSCSCTGSFHHTNLAGNSTCTSGLVGSCIKSASRAGGTHSACTVTAVYSNHDVISSKQCYVFKSALCMSMQDVSVQPRRSLAVTITHHMLRTHC